MQIKRRTKNQIKIIIKNINELFPKAQIKTKLNKLNNFESQNQFEMSEYKFTRNNFKLIL